MAKYLDSAGVTHLVSKLKSDVIPNVKVNAAKKADTVDASGIQGVIDISHIPQGALERVVQVKDDTARFQLTSEQVQLGDTVKVLSNGKMYIVIDEDKLNVDAGYMEYASGSASSVPWSGITDKPDSFKPSEHTHQLELTIGKSTVSGKVSGSLTFPFSNIFKEAFKTSGSGNAITGITVPSSSSVDQNSIFLNKDTTFATGSELNDLDGRVSELETNMGDGGSIAAQLEKAGYDIVLFGGFLDEAPTVEDSGVDGTGKTLCILKGSDLLIVGDGTVPVKKFYVKDSAGKYYQSFTTLNRFTPDNDGAAYQKLYNHKLYIDTTTNKVYYASSDTTLTEVGGSDTALTNDEIDAAIDTATMRLSDQGNAVRVSNDGDIRLDK